MIEGGWVGNVGIHFGPAVFGETSPRFDDSEAKAATKGPYETKIIRRKGHKSSQEFVR